MSIARAIHRHREREAPEHHRNKDICEGHLDMVAAVVGPRADLSATTRGVAPPLRADMAGGNPRQPESANSGWPPLKRDACGADEWLIGRDHREMLEASENALARCEHLCQTTTRYDHGQKELSFLLVCAVCGTDELIEAIQYEPRFTEHAIGEPARLAA